MTAHEIPAALDDDHRRHVVAGEPQIFHCHHYNTFLQRTIQDADYIDSAPFLIGAAAEVAHVQLKSWFDGAGVTDPAERARMADRLYQWAGFGRWADLSDLGPEGGIVRTPDAHYSFGWKAKFGPTKDPVDYFGTGWLAGAASAIWDRPLGAYSAVQTACLATPESDANEYGIMAGEANYPVWQSVGLGPLTSHDVRAVPANPVDYEGIYGAVTGLPLAGDEHGIIPAFGVYLTHHYANYYNRISFEFERQLTEQFGDFGREVAEPLLVEAGHVCAFNTFGGIMTSPEWDALIRPSLQTREDWVHGMVAVVNALGWGRWQVTSVTPACAEFVVHDDYESVGHLAMYGPTDHDISYLARGGVAGVMDLVYVGDIASKPDLTPDFYDRLFKSDESYSVDVVSSRAAGDEVTAFRVSR